MNKRVASLSSHSTPSANRLQGENRQLRSQLHTLIQQARDNEQILQRHHQINLKLIGASSLAELFDCIFSDLKKSSALDSLTLLVTGAEFDLRRAITDLGLDPKTWPDLLLLPNMNSNDFSPSNTLKPELGPFSPDRHGVLFPADLPNPTSVAIVPLHRQERLLGYLNFGSHDATRFGNDVATDFVEEQASIVAICLENVINNERLKHLGLTDPLTGVYNRRFIETRLHEEIRRTQRQGYALSCLYIDIDHFKQINDTLGHRNGDEVLREVAARIKTELRLSDTLGRFGGEEFVVLLSDTPVTGARNVAERIRAGIANIAFRLESGQSCQSSVSIGVATLQADHASRKTEHLAQQLIADADRALYQAKNTGRNRVATND